MKFYLAAKFSRREEMEQKANELETYGFKPNCRWVFGGEEGLTRRDICMLDLEDVEESDLIVLFTHPRAEPQPGGGRFVEFGYAMALSKKLVVIGPEENVFLTHPDISRYDTWEEFLEKHPDV